MDGPGDVLLGQALELLRKGDHAGADRIMGITEDELRADPGVAVVFASAKWMLSGNFGNAEDAAEVAIRRRLLLDAEALLERAVTEVTVDALRAGAWGLLGTMRLLLGKPYAEAAEALERAVALDPTQTKFAEMLATLRAAR